MKYNSSMGTLEKIGYASAIIGSALILKYSGLLPKQTIVEAKDLSIPKIAVSEMIKIPSVLNMKNLYKKLE